METCPQREVVVEIEHTRVVRKRTSTSIRFCPGCGKQTDFVPLAKAAELFDLAPATIYEFITRYSCHFAAGKEGEIHICLADLLTAMGKRIRKGNIKLLGEIKNEEASF